jgi:NAD(P)-dependent dehydrogenase (short-subunit alcohol dehydrogenase family)
MNRLSAIVRAMAPTRDLGGLHIGLTGGGGHLGSAMALGLAQAGARVVITGRHAEPLEEVAARALAAKYAGSVVVAVADVSNAADTERVLDVIAEPAARVDGWVNNAYNGAGGLLGKLSRSDVESSIASALTDVIMASEQVANRMKAQGGGGAIVNIASMYGMVSPQPAMYERYPAFHNPVAYGASKAGVLQFTRYAACHLAPYNIRVNAISPGPFPSDATQATDGFVDELVRRVPLGRIGEPADLVGPLVFLLSSASGFVTGHNLVVDGGWTAW